MTEFHVSAPLARAVVAALQAFSKHWHKAMQPALEPTEDGAQIVSDYAYAMRGAALDAIPIAARRWISEHKMPPKPSEFGALCREVTRERFPNVSREDLRQHPSYQPAIESPKDTARIDALGRRAYQALGSWRLVGEVWALLIHTAPHEDHRQAAREGRVPTDVFDDAIAAVKQGRRAPVGPLAVGNPAA